jgi:asparagine synthase (glutamine-hydrolysing)
MFTDSIKKRLVADVPVGVYLSGGIDSAAITGIASELKSEPIKTFSVGFDYNNEVDELQQARKVSNHFNTDHTEIIVKDRIGNLLPKLIWQLDQPHGDPVIIPQFMLSKTAKDKVKVVLSGEGADEMFAGYVQYKNYLFAQKIKHFPLKSTMAKIVPVSLFDKFFDYPSSMGAKGKEKVIDLLSDLKNPEKSYNDLITILSNKDNQLLFDKEFPKDVGPGNFNASINPLLNKLLYYDTKKWLPNYVLYINDRMTMANSIEGRVPFLDHKLVNYATTIPSNFKLGNNITK